MSEARQKPITDSEPPASGDNATRVPPVSSSFSSRTETNFSSNRSAPSQGIIWDLCLVGGILVLALSLRLWHLSALTDNYDEGVYWASLRALHAGNGLFTP